MPRGRRHRLTGTLLEVKRGLILEVDDGGVWSLHIDTEARLMLGRRVTVEGVRRGFDLLDVQWFGSAEA